MHPDHPQRQNRPIGRQIELGRVSRPTVLDTTELRWFAVGELPTDVSVWFTRAGQVGAAEQRCDTYQLGRGTDVGVKLRSQETLEVKARQSVGVPLMLSFGLAGRLEVWRKWSPADGLADTRAGGLWLDVHKTVVKRRFATDGTEVPAVDVAWSPAHAGVDVETVAVTVGAVRVWSFAFAAFGPVTSRRPALVSCWRALARTSPPPTLDFSTSESCGYPEYLAIIASRLAEPDRSLLHSGGVGPAATW